MLCVDPGFIKIRWLFSSGFTTCSLSSSAQFHIVSLVSQFLPIFYYELKLLQFDKRN
jgi:hypothetical protein